MKKWNIGWGAVSACNMNCEFCYSSEKRKCSTDITYQDWKRFVDENAMSIATINYGTGENAISADWFKLIRYIRANYPHIRQALTTNGFVSEAVKKNPEHMSAFLEAIDEVDVSLDFADAKRHGEFRGQPRAYEWAVSAMELCHNNKIPLTIVIMGSRVNLYEENLRGIFEVAKRFDAIVRINMYRPTNGINGCSSRYILSIEDLLKCLRFLNDNYSVLSLNDPLLSSLLTDETVSDPSGIDSLRILPNGDVTPSTYLITDEYVIANLRENVSLECIEERILQKGIIKRVTPNDCGNCVHKDTCCGGVLDRRYLWYGNLNRKDPYCFADNSELKNKYNFKIKLSEEKFQSVHNGYLPTMFFKNR